MRRILTIQALALMAAAIGFLANGGCAPAVVVTAGITAGLGLAQTQANQFINGELKAGRMVTMDDARAAVRAAMNELQLTIKADRRRTHKAYMMGQAPGADEIGVSFSTISPIATKIEIRVGIFGDQAVSQLVMERIDRVLKPPKDVQATQPAADASTQPSNPASINRQNRITCEPAPALVDK
jgi:Protein of unknown function (DUF3568)